MSYTNQPPYTLLSVGSQLRERMMFAVEQQTPELATELPFKRFVKFPAQSSLGDDTPEGGEPAYQQIEQTTDEQRWRSVYVRSSQMGRGDNSDGENTKHYAVRLNLIIGYPKEALIKLDVENDSTSVYDVEDLILHDTEHLVDVLCDEGIFSEYQGEAAIPGFVLIEWLGAVRTGNVVTHSFLVRYERVRA